MATLIIRFFLHLKLIEEDVILECLKDVLSEIQTYDRCTATTLPVSYSICCSKWKKLYLYWIVQVVLVIRILKLTHVLTEFASADILWSFKHTVWFSVTITHFTTYTVIIFILIMIYFYNVLFNAFLYCICVYDVGMRLLFSSK